MDRETYRHLLTGVLLFLAVASWWNAFSLYREYKGEIAIALSDITREVALPFRIALLSLQDPVEVLPMPVYAVLVSEVADTWGDARSEGRTHEGTDIFASRGTPVFSATDGFVLRVNFGTRGGNNVMVTGPGGVRYYYAHFERVADGIEVGLPVTRDTVLGFVGNSGNATATPPHLHFGLYEHRQAQNPYPLLVDRWDE